MSGFRDSGFGVSGYSIWGALGGQAQRDLGGGMFWASGLQGLGFEEGSFKGNCKGFYKGYSRGLNNIGA